MNPGHHALYVPYSDKVITVTIIFIITVVVIRLLRKDR